MEDPAAEVVEAAATQADAIARTAASIALGCAVLGVAGVAMLALLPTPGVGLAAVLVAVVLGGLYTVAWRRAAAASSFIRDGPYVYVRVVGWCRANDGCNYAVFVNHDAERPDVVVRLPLRRPMRPGGYAWAAGVLVPSAEKGVALFDRSGLLATGQCADHVGAMSRWERRGAEPGRLVQRPPEDWFPPAGS